MLWLSDVPRSPKAMVEVLTELEGRLTDWEYEYVLTREAEVHSLLSSVQVVNYYSERIKILEEVLEPLRSAMRRMKDWPPELDSDLT